MHLWHIPWGGGGSPGGYLKWYVEDLGLSQVIHQYLAGFPLRMDLVLLADSRYSFISDIDNFDIA